MAEKHILYQGKKVFYFTKGEGTPLLLIHGYQCDASVWNSIVMNLCEGFHLIIPDLPGHGKSELLASEQSMDTLADVCRKIISAEGFSSCYVAGHSMGGYVALAFENFQECIGHIILISAHPFSDSEEKINSRLKEKRFLEAGKKQMLIKNFMSLNFSSSTEKLNPELIEEASKIALRQPLEGMFADINAMIKRPNRNSLLNSSRLLIIYGEEDSKLISTGVLGLTHNIELIPVPDCGHMCILEKPRQIALIIESKILSD